MFLKSLVLGLQVKVSVHEGLVGVVDGLEVGVLSSLLDLKRVELSLHRLESGSELVSSVILVAVSLEFHLLIFDQGGIRALKSVDLDI